jgi:hypothetical protein
MQHGEGDSREMDKDSLRTCFGCDMPKSTQIVNQAKFITTYLKLLIFFNCITALLHSKLYAFKPNLNASKKSS